MTEGSSAPFGFGRAWAAVCITWFALVAAASELLARFVNARLLHGVVFYGPATIWMTPLADLVLFALASLPLFLLALAIHPLRRPRALIAWMAFLAASTITLQVPGLHPAAAYILALGVASVASAIMISRAGATGRLIRVTLPVLFLLFLGALILQPLLERRSESRQNAALPAPRSGAPNVLFLIFDTVRASSLGLYGGPPTTPSLQAVAARGVTFDRAIAPASYTLASHASFFTGRWPRDLGVTWTTPLDGRFPVIAEIFQHAGYRTGGFSANRPYVSRPYGLARGFSHFSDYATNAGEVLRNAELGRTFSKSPLARPFPVFDDLLGRKHAAETNAAILRWAARDTTRPFFVFANYFDAHEPYLPPAPCDTAFGWYRSSTPAAERRQLRREARLSPEQIGVAAAKQRITAYEGAIACLDADIGRLLADMESRGLLRNTIVVLASDHGEEFAEHGVFDHGNSLYLPSLHVPLVIAYPGHVPAGARVSHTVSLRDLPATILDLAGLGTALPGRSLRRLWEGAHDTSVVDTVLAEIPFAPRLPAVYPVSAGDMRSIVTDRFQYIRDGRGREELFDLARDPEGAVPASDTAAQHSLRRLIPPGHD